MHRVRIVFLIISSSLILLISACATSGEALSLRRVADPDLSITKSDRSNCAQIGTSDLRSPKEGIWYQAHCLAPSLFPQGVATTACNRLSVAAAEFRQVAPNLHVFRQTLSATAYLWYATTPDCFDLVSGRVVKAVCADGAISFQSDRRLSCADHSGALVLINGN